MIEEGGSAPQHQVNLRSFVELPKHFLVDALFYWIDELPILEVSSYAKLDASVSWAPRDYLELRAGGRNLLDDQHLEFVSTRATVRVHEIERSFSVKISWRF